MPERMPALRELSALLGVLSHPARLRIVEELGQGERDVNSLQVPLRISHSAVSQHLSVLRAHRLVSERREGRHVFYRLRQPELAAWLVEGLQFIQGDPADADALRFSVELARASWSRPAEVPAEGPAEPSPRPRTPRGGASRRRSS